MKRSLWPTRDAVRDYFPLPKEIFSLGLSAAEIAIYAYLLFCEDRQTFQCWPSYRKIGEAVGLSPNTIRKHIRSLEEHELLITEPTMVTTKDGKTRNGLCSFAFGGAEGMAKMQSLMDGLRADAPKAIAGLAVESVVDYEQDGTGLPKANVLEYRLAGGEKFIVRPSGTEPKIKTYLSALAPTAAEAAQEEAKLKAAAEEMMK